MPQLNIGLPKFGVPTRLGNTHYTEKRARHNAMFGFIISYGCAGADGIMSAVGLFQLLEIFTDNWSALIVTIYGLISIVAAGFVILGIRAGGLRMSPYAPTVNHIREDKTIQGPLVQIRPEDEVIQASNNGQNRVYLICWIYAIASNVVAFMKLFWAHSIAPILAGGANINAGSLILAFSVVIAVGLLSYGVPWMGHIGEGYAYQFEEYAEILGAQVGVAVTKALGSQPKP